MNSHRVMATAAAAISLATSVAVTLSPAAAAAHAPNPAQMTSQNPPSDVCLDDGTGLGGTHSERSCDDNAPVYHGRHRGADRSGHPTHWSPTTLACDNVARNG